MEHYWEAMEMVADKEIRLAIVASHTVLVTYCCDTEQLDSSCRKMGLERLFSLNAGRHGWAK